jgi:hypothetical protein
MGKTKILYLIDIQWKRYSVFRIPYSDVLDLRVKRYESVFSVLVGGDEIAPYEYYPKSS